MWTVQNAKSHLSEVLRLAKSGEPQVIGTVSQCVVISLEAYQALQGQRHLGRWLVENRPSEVAMEIELPSRGDRDADPFAESED